MGRYDQAAVAFAETRRPFEELCLKFVNAGARLALRRYVQLRLRRLGGVDGAAMQRTLLATWLVEQYLDALNSLQPAAAQRGGAASSEYDETLREFRAFLRESEASLHRPTTLALLASHGREDELLYYCELGGDHARIVTHHVQRAQWAEALEALRSAPVGPAAGGGAGGSDASGAAAGLGSFAELWYRYAPLLLQNRPAETVRAWQEAGQAVLDPLRLLPALVRYEQVSGRRGAAPPCHWQGPRRAALPPPSFLGRSAAPLLGAPSPPAPRSTTRWCTSSGSSTRRRPARAAASLPCTTSCCSSTPSSPSRTSSCDT